MTTVRTPESIDGDPLRDFESRSRDSIKRVTNWLPSGTGLYGRVAKLAVELTQEVLEAQRNGIPEEQIVQSVSEAVPLTPPRQ